VLVSLVYVSLAFKSSFSAVDAGSAVN
jgi:hypothetical protein